MDSKPTNTPGAADQHGSGLEVVVDPCWDGQKHVVDASRPVTSHTAVVSPTGGYPPTEANSEARSPLYPPPSTSPPIESDKIISQHAHAHAHHHHPGSAWPQTPQGGERAPLNYASHQQQQGQGAAWGSGRGSGGSSRKRTATFVAVAALVAVVAGVLGGIAGWQITEAKNRGGSGGSGGGDNTTSTCPGLRREASIEGASATVRKGSPLAATGYRYGGDYQMHLFYLSPDGTPHTSLFDTAYNTWSLPVKLSGAAAHASTPLAAGVNMRNHYNQFVPTFEVHYVSADSKFTAVGIKLPEQKAGQPQSSLAQSLSDHPVRAGASIGAYWPHVVFQDDSSAGGLVENNITIHNIRNSSQRVGRIMAGGDGLSGPAIAPGSPLVALPLSPEVPRTELRVVYRSTDGDGRLAVWDRDSRGGEARREHLPAAFAVPQGRPLAGFATRRGSSTLATRLVWRAADGRFMTGWQDGGGPAAAWMGPEAVEGGAFGDAADDSGLACVTAASTSQESIKEPIQEKDDMNRCFYQRKNGALAEVWYDGEKWRDVGHVHMPMP